MTGAKGDPGEAGADGTLRIYGDGSAGAHTVSGNEDWLSSPPANLQFTNFTIDAGANLMVPSGTIIRVTGTFTNNGNISAAEGAFGGEGYTLGAPLPLPPAAGIAFTAATGGELGPNTAHTRSGTGGRGMLELQARMLLRPGAVAGGAGAGSLGDSGGGGGASFTVLARGAISNTATATISANGYDALGLGGGGGGGGIVILASMTSVTNAGVIDAKGGSPMPVPSNTTGPGGGGGGGIVHLLAPTVALGTVHVTGGSGATNNMTVNQSPRSGGGGGGASGGRGGSGGDVTIAGTANASQPGQPGYALTSLGDPSALF